MNEYRCEECHKLLFKGKFTGIIEVMCVRCKKLNKLKLECQCKEHQS